jgi:acetylornithine deacetylase/succinyl-diaminopimelate desuccinylase-like protein
MAHKCLSLLFAVAVLGTLAQSGHAQAARSLDEALADDGVLGALDYVDASTAGTARFLAEIGGIISPSGQELERAEAVGRRMREIGLSNVEVDGTPNAVGMIPGRSGRALVFVSTLDDLATVAENQRAASGPPQVDGDRVLGPGTNTSLTTAAMIAAAEALVVSGMTPEHDLIFAAVAQEETGLIGMKDVYEEYRDRAVGFVDVLGEGASISYGAINIHWWTVVASGPPGHSLGGGLPNVNQGIGRAVDRILQLHQPAMHPESRTVVNISMLNSGAVYNHKPETGWFSLDLRSMEARLVEEMEAEVRSILATVSEETDITFEMQPFQLTPGGQLPGARESVLVTSAEAISRHLGLDPPMSDIGSSNMNVAIGNGTSAIGISGSRGGQRGFPDEWANIPAMMRTAKHILLLSSTVGGAQSGR